jgi:lipoprotein-releasing system permease protein
MLKIFLWLRYLGKRRVVLLSIAAVAISCALLITVASIFTGFIDAFEQSAVNSLGDVILSPGGDIKDFQELTRRIEKLNDVTAAAGTLSTQGLLHLGKGNVRAVEIWGIEVQKEGKVTNFEKSLLNLQKTQDARPPFDKLRASQTQDQQIEGYIGIGVLAEPNEQTDEYDFNAVETMIGRQAVLTTGSTSLTTGGSAVKIEGSENQFKKRTIQFTIADVVFTGIYYLDSRLVYLPIDRLCKTIYPEQEQPVARQIHIKLRKGADTDLSVAQIRSVWEAFASEKLGWGQMQIQWARIETARQMQARYVGEIRKQMGVLLLIFGVVSLSTVLLVFCIFYMLVEHRRRDVAILKSCGAASGTIAIIFMGFGGFVGVIGASLGTALGYYITRHINSVDEWIRIIFGLKLWKASVYMFSTIPNEVDWQAVVWITIAAIIGAVLGATIPAISAALTKPVSILRYE